MEEGLETMSGEIHCYLCGVGPMETTELRAGFDTVVRVTPTAWPDGDHEHAVAPPTSDRQIAAALQEWTGTSDTGQPQPMAEGSDPEPRVQTLCIGCRRPITRKGWFWRDPYGSRACAYRWAGLGFHKPRRQGATGGLT